MFVFAPFLMEKFILPECREGFEIPPKILKIIFEEDLDLSQAARKVGLTEETKIGNSVGIISLLTNGKINRKNQIKQSIEMAMPRILCPQFYK